MKQGKNYILAGVVLAISMVFLGCTGLGKIGDGQHLYTGSSIDFDTSGFVGKKGVVENELLDLIELKPNTKLLWMRPFLSIHNTLPKPKKDKGFWFWLKYKFGEPPSLIENVNPSNLSLTMENRLQNRGYFHARVAHDVSFKRKTAGISFTATAGKPYIINTVEYPDGETPILQEIHRMQAGSLLKSGDQYHLKSFEDERTRIDEQLKDKGYFYFSPDYLLFNADSSVGGRKINVEIKLKPEISEDAFLPYQINNVYVTDDYSLLNYRPDTTLIGDFYYISGKHRFKPKIILKAVFFEKDSLYSRTNHYNTLRYLMGLGVYKFTNARFSRSEAEKGKINASLLLTPVKKMSLSSEMSVAAKTNNYAGPGLNLIFRNRNVFGGAELLTVNLGGRFEVQVGTDKKGQYNYEITLDGSITLPRIVPGEMVRKTSRQFVPNTIFTLGGGVFSRVSLYELYSFNISMGYSWKPSGKVSHLLRPIDMSFTQLAKSSPEFEEYLDQNPNIRKSMEEQFIPGSSYTFTLSNMHQTWRKTNFYLNESFELAGNLAELIMTSASGTKSTPENPHKLLNVAFSQFARLRNEVRYFYKTGKQSLLGWRLIAAAAIPYRNSSTIPYVKQFYVGGTNSLRAFPARSVGPGSYVPADSLTTGYTDQTGDIKLETSLEYRFPIYKYFRGALYLDAGNIWLVNNDENRQGGEFDIKTFYSELAVGGGYGLRFDFSYIVLRFDMAIPLRKPWLPDGDKWAFDDINFGSPAWRKQNLITNVAIGYPF